MSDRTALLRRFAGDFIGLDRSDPVARLDGTTAIRRRVYLDTTATALMPGSIWRALEDYLAAASANSHTEAHRAGRDTTRAIEDSRDAIGRLVGYDPHRDVVIFTSNGATGATNFLARALFPPEVRPLVKRFPGGCPAELAAALRGAFGAEGRRAIDELVARPLVVTTQMEHHSNLLPWIEAVGHHNLRAADVHRDDGTLDLDHLGRILAAEGPRVRLVAVTGVSNVTGIVNPVHQIARMAHAVGAELMVDGAQWVPHGPVRLHGGAADESIDYLVFSGHKMYAPGSRGALVGRLATLEQRTCVSDVGGGMVEYVSIDDYSIKHEVAAREEAGTPNILGTIAMGLAAELLMTIGMDTIAEAEEALTRRLVERLEAIDGVTVFGATDLARVPRAGVVSFAAHGLPHGLVASYLDDFHDIAVRDGCFCAQPYVKALCCVDPDAERRVREQLARGDRRAIPGMVRASLGIYSTADDIEALAEALTELGATRDQVLSRYQADVDGTYRLQGGPVLPRTFVVADRARNWAAG
ncbi:MAG TPA: aminotransferase class V-fold PLP-dependent enzyme [Kofleriaceae bacterium]|nr:aminotransferase class V-fold PLP-dependent enzyme [Kofleriaceae bacterium]